MHCWMYAVSGVVVVLVVLACGQVDASKGDTHLTVQLLLSPDMIKRLSFAITNRGESERSNSSWTLSNDTCVLNPGKRKDFAEAKKFCVRRGSLLPTFTQSLKLDAGNMTWLAHSKNATRCRQSAAIRPHQCAQFMMMGDERCFMLVSCKLRRNFYCVKNPKNRSGRHRRSVTC